MINRWWVTLHFVLFHAGVWSCLIQGVTFFCQAIWPCLIKWSTASECQCILFLLPGFHPWPTGGEWLCIFSIFQDVSLSLIPWTWTGSKWHCTLTQIFFIFQQYHNISLNEHMVVSDTAFHLWPHPIISCHMNRRMWAILHFFFDHSLIISCHKNVSNMPFFFGYTVSASSHDSNRKWVHCNFSFTRQSHQLHPMPNSMWVTLHCPFFAKEF